MIQGQSPAGREQGRVGWASACCMGGMAAIAVATTLLPIIVPVASSQLGGPAGLTFEQRGRLLAALTAGFVSALVLSGPMADRGRPKPFAVAGNALVGAGLLALATAQGYGTALVGCVLMGTGAGLLDMVLSPIVARLYSERRVEAMNRLHATYALSAVAVSAIAVVLLRAGVPWPRLLASFAAAPWLVAAAFMAAELPRLAHPAEIAAWGVILQAPGFRLWAGILFGVGAVMAGVGQWIPALARESMRLTPSGGGMAMTLFLLGMGASRLAAARWFSGWPPHRMLGVCLAIVQGLLVLVAVTEPPSLALAAAVLVGLASGALWPTVLAAAAGDVPAGGGTLFGWLSAAGNAGCFAAPWAIGILADFVGLRPALLIVAAPASLSLILAVRRGRARPPPAGSPRHSIGRGD